MIQGLDASLMVCEPRTMEGWRRTGSLDDLHQYRRAAVGARLRTKPGHGGSNCAGSNGGPAYSTVVCGESAPRGLWGSSGVVRCLDDNAAARPRPSAGAGPRYEPSDALLINVVTFSADPRMLAYTWPQVECLIAELPPSHDRGNLRGRTVAAAAKQMSSLACVAR